MPPVVPQTLIRMLQQLSEQRAQGAIDTATWEHAFSQLLAQYHLAAYAHGASLPLRQLTPADHALVQAAIDRQREYLKGFGDDWDSGRYHANVDGTGDTIASALNRSSMYADATTGSWWMGNTRGYPLPAWPADGTTTCKTKCTCRWRIVPLGGSGNADAYWERGGGSEHCQTCDQRAEDWSPLEIREGDLQLKSFVGIAEKGWRGRV